MKAILGGTLVNPGAEPVPDSAILVDGGRITAAGTQKDVRIPSGTGTIDATGKWILPGLIDAHIHFFQSGGLYTRPDILNLTGRVPYADEMAALRERIPDTFLRYLRCGVTSVVDVGGPFWNFAVRERAGASGARAPRAAVAGPLISTWQPQNLDPEDPPIVKILGEAEARDMVRRQAALKPDLVKIWYIVRDGAKPRDHINLVRAVADETHRHGLRLAVHATELETARCAVEAGADILVHSIFDKEVDEPFVALMKERGTLYTTTIMVTLRYAETFAQKVSLHPCEHAWAHAGTLGTLFDLREFRAEELNQRVRDLLASPDPVLPSAAAQRNLKILHDAGIPVAAGTDAGNIGTPHGPAIFRELDLMRESGLSPAQVLRTATEGGARVFGAGAGTGRIAPGFHADLSILDADPLADLKNLAAIHRVMKGGELIDPAGLFPVSAEDVVQRQVNAYNARDLEAFLATYSDDVTVTGNLADGAVTLKGRAAMAERYGTLFRKSPALHARITRRIALGDWVIDREQASGFEGGKTLDVVAMYRVENGKIRQVWFAR